MWSEYKIGNALRGIYLFKARSIKEAWKRGCKLFNEGFPSENGRLITLTMRLSTNKVPYVTKYIIEQRKLPKDKRYFSNLEDGTSSTQWVEVAYGNSKEKLVKNT